MMTVMTMMTIFHPPCLPSALSLHTKELSGPRLGKDQHYHHDGDPYPDYHHHHPLIVIMIIGFRKQKMGKHDHRLPTVSQLQVCPIAGKVANLWIEMTRFTIERLVSSLKNKFCLPDNDIVMIVKNHRVQLSSPSSGDEGGFSPEKGFLLF